MDMQNLDQSKFEKTFAELPAKRMKVLRMLLAGNTDVVIAQSLNIEAGTVRTQIAQICKAFGLSDSSGERRSRRADLLTLFAKYKPELVGKKSKPFDSKLKIETISTKSTKVISNSDSDQTGEDSHSPTPNYRKPEDTQTRFTLVLSGTVSEVDRARAEAIIAHLKNVVGDVEMTLEEIKPGSVLLVCSSSPEDIEVIEWMFKSGQLSDLLGFSVLDVRLETTSEGAIVPKLVNLSEWLQNDVVEAGWHKIEEIFGTQLPFLLAPIRNGADIFQAIMRGKVIDLGTPLARNRIALLVSVTPESNEKLCISLQVYPAGEQTDLPENLQMSLLDEFKRNLMQARANRTDSLMVELTGIQGEHFSVKVALDNTSITENFVI